MKKYIIVAMAIGLATGNTWASCKSFSSCSGCMLVNRDEQTDRCASTSTTYYGFTENNYMATYAVESCSRCSGNNTAFSTSVQLSPSCTVSYTACKCTACNASNCPTGSWHSYLTGAEARDVGICTTDCTCDTSTEYRCRAGYYGDAGNNGRNCTKCPGGGTSATGSTSITDCYMSSGSTGTDSTGTFIYTSNCYYSN